MEVATGFVEIFDFNQNTVNITSRILLDMFNDKLRDENTDYTKNPMDNRYGVLYGIEFSRNGNFLYTSETYSYSNNDSVHIIQFNIDQYLSPALLWANRRVIAHMNFPCGTNFSGTYGALQMGPDGNIYVARSGQAYISRINNCETSSASFEDHAVDLVPGQTSKIGLPTMLVNDVSCGACANCHNVSFSFNGLKTVKRDTTLILHCDTRSIDFTPNLGCSAPNIVSVIGCRVTDENGAIQSWASAVTNTKGNGSLAIPNAATPPVTYYVDYYFGTMNSPGPSSPRYDTCDHIRLTIIDSCMEVSCVCPPKPKITLTLNGRPGTVKQLNCGASEEVECNKSYTIDVDPACQPANCSDKRYEISVRANGEITPTFFNQAGPTQPQETDKKFDNTKKTQTKIKENHYDCKNAYLFECGHTFLISNMIF